MLNNQDQFHIISLSSPQGYKTKVGACAELQIEPGAMIKELNGTFRGSNNVIIIESDASANNITLNVSGDNNIIKIHRGARICNTTIRINGYTYDENFIGIDNIIQIGPQSIISDSRIECSGSYNKMCVGAKVYAAQNCELYLHGFGCLIRIGDRTSMTNAYIHAEEIESSIDIGQDNMFAPYVSIATSDKHPIYFIDTFRRMNTAKDIITGKHVWLATGVQCFKGSVIGDHCIIGKHTAILHPIIDPASGEIAHHAVIHGSPAAVHKTDVNWNREMLFDLDDEISKKYPDAAAQTWFHRANILVNDGTESFTQGLPSQAETYYHRAVDAYQIAISHKDDFVYAHCALGVAKVRLAELYLDRLQMVVMDLLRTAISLFEKSLKFDKSHGDSILYKEFTLRALENVEQYFLSDRDTFHALSEIALAHLRICSLEWSIFNPDMAGYQYKRAEFYIKKAAKKGAIPENILLEQKKINQFSTMNFKI